MKILVDNMNELASRVGYEFTDICPDRQVNTLANYWLLLEEKEKEIQMLTGESLETILHSKYFWCTQCKNNHDRIYGEDVGIDQQQYKILEEIDQRTLSVDWSLIQRIEEELDHV